MTFNFFSPNSINNLYDFRSKTLDFKVLMNKTVSFKPVVLYYKFVYFCPHINVINVIDYHACIKIGDN